MVEHFFRYYWKQHNQLAVNLSHACRWIEIYSIVWSQKSIISIDLIQYMHANINIVIHNKLKTIISTWNPCYILAPASFSQFSSTVVQNGLRICYISLYGLFPILRIWGTTVGKSFLRTSKFSSGPWPWWCRTDKSSSGSNSPPAASWRTSPLPGSSTPSTSYVKNNLQNRLDNTFISFTFGHVNIN